MENKRLTNSLLAIIAAALVLITLKLYDINFVAEAQAQSEVVARLKGCFRSSPVATCDWRDIEVNKNGQLRIGN